MVQELDKFELREKKELEDALIKLKLQKESEIRKLTSRQFAQKLIETKVIAKVKGSS